MAEAVPYVLLERPEDLDALEGATGLRHEVVDGVAFAMVGGTVAHNLITMNLAAMLHEATRGGSCSVFQQGQRLRLETVGRLYYPDVMVCCDPSDDDPREKIAPRLLGEVLSPSTTRDDAGEKLMAYQTLPSLETYLMVHATRSEVWMHRKVDGWKRQTSDLSDPLPIPEFDLTLTFETLYDRVRF